MHLHPGDPQIPEVTPLPQSIKGLPVFLFYYTPMWEGGRCQLAQKRTPGFGAAGLELLSLSVGVCFDLGEGKPLGCVPTSRDGDGRRVWVGNVDFNLDEIFQRSD